MQRHRHSCKPAGFRLVAGNAPGFLPAVYHPRKRQSKKKTTRKTREKNRLDGAYELHMLVSPLSSKKEEKKRMKSSLNFPEMCLPKKIPLCPSICRPLIIFFPPAFLFFFFFIYHGETINGCYLLREEQVVDFYLFFGVERE